jgi:hypothetical protein
MYVVHTYIWANVHSIVHPRPLPPGVNTLYSLEERRGEQSVVTVQGDMLARPLGSISPLGASFTPKVQFHPGI